MQIMTLHEQGQHDQSYTPSYIPAHADPARQQVTDTLCFEVPLEDYTLALDATRRTDPEGRREWMTIHNTSAVIVEVLPKLALIESSGDDPNDPESSLSPLLGGQEPGQLAPLLGDVRTTWKGHAGSRSEPQTQHDIVLEARQASVRRRLFGILPIGKTEAVAKVTGYRAFREP